MTAKLILEIIYLLQCFVYASLSIHWTLEYRKCVKIDFVKHRDGQMCLISLIAMTFFQSYVILCFVFMFTLIVLLNDIIYIIMYSWFGSICCMATVWIIEISIL